MKEYRGRGEQRYGSTYIYTYIPSLGFIYIRTVEALESKDTCAFHFHERDETLYLDTSTDPERHVFMTNIK
jgi:hypothetical protein